MPYLHFRLRPSLFVNKNAGPQASDSEHVQAERPAAEAGGHQVPGRPPHICGRGGERGVDRQVGCSVVSFKGTVARKSC